MLRSKHCRLRSLPHLPRRRLLHDNGIYGYQAPKEFKLPDFTEQELANRAANGSLVRLVESYRRHGHRAATLDPLDLQHRPPVPALDPRRYGFSLPDSLKLDQEYTSETVPAPAPELSDVNKKYDLAGIFDYGSSTKEDRSIEEIQKRLSKVYCDGVAYEFMHIPNKHERVWIGNMLENLHSAPFSKEQKIEHWKLLTNSETFDKWLGKRFPSVKRYSLEGAESMMIALDRIFDEATKIGTEEVVLGMPHRGRLNVLAQLLNFDMRTMVRKLKGHAEISDEMIAQGFTGDVLSHLFCSPVLDRYRTPLRVSMLPNPSHLEAINGVALGFARALQVPSDAKELGDKVMSVQLHGDSAFNSQGVVAEAFNLTTLPHFAVGGTIRLVVNNQLGYTTPAIQGRSSFYASDLAKFISCPVIHVNADRVEDVSRAVALACEYRNKFRKDVVIDLIAYRRWGHNELDEPTYTSPLMYNKIRGLKPVAQSYESALLSEGVLDSQAAKSQREATTAALEEAYAAADSFKIPNPEMRDDWKNMKWSKDAIISPETGVDKAILQKVGKQSVATPEGFTIHSRLGRTHVQKRLQSLESEKGIDFSTAEALAFGTLMLDGYNVRVSGQDCGRGTFSQRHAILADQNTEKCIVPLNGLETSARAEFVNSPLSEYAVMAFEQGISWASSKTLPIWEAQFGDFYNGAQIIIDTFLASGETKWLMQSGLTLALPHGYDGAGPDHSSAHMERFLQITDEPLTRPESYNPNMHIIQPTTAAQLFHALRRQMVREYRKPLVIIGPKSTLRLAAAASSLDEMGPGTSWQPVLSDASITDPQNVERVVFLSGKMYFDLVQARQDAGLEGKVAFVRLEELCPFPYEALEEVIAQYSNAKSYIWAQEEASNSGAYVFVAPRLSTLLNGSALKYVGRGAEAAVVTGISSEFKKQKEALLKKSLGL